MAHVVMVQEVLGGERRLETGEHVIPIVIDTVLIRIHHAVPRQGRGQLHDGVPGPEVARRDEGDVLPMGRRQSRRE